MPNFNDILSEVNAVGSAGSPFDVVRRKYIKQLSDLTGRNVIVYYSAWLQKGIPQLAGLTGITDLDKNGFMAAIHQLNRELGLDLVLHTPGGEAAATESLVDYLRQMFGTDIRAIIPQMAMSAGTMIALSTKAIIMGKHSNLGPIDPQIGGLPAHGIIEEFDSARDQIKESKTAQEQAAQIARWQPIIAKYSPTLIGACQKAIAWANDMVTAWLNTGMFNGDLEAPQKSKKIVDELGSHALMKSHARHVPMERLKELGVNIIAFEDDPPLQDAVLAVHHACMLTLQQTQAVKIIENQNSVAFIIAAQINAAPPQQQPQPPQGPQQPSQPQQPTP